MHADPGDGFIGGLRVRNKEPYVTLCASGNQLWLLRVHILMFSATDSGYGGCAPKSKSLWGSSPAVGKWSK
jgi:hypothetical protein